MTPTEFKAWFDGFTEALSGVPTEVQWARIKARVAEIDGRPITQQVYIDRYWPQRIYDYPRPYWREAWTCSAQSSMGAAISCDNTAVAEKFDSMNAMYSAGRNDMASLLEARS